MTSERTIAIRCFVRQKVVVDNQVFAHIAPLALTTHLLLVQLHHGGVLYFKWPKQNIVNDVHMPK